MLAPSSSSWSVWLVIGLFSASISAHSDSDGENPCRKHGVLDDGRRSPLYQARTSRDLLCDQHLHGGWYRFTINNKSAEIPTRCAPVNYCGTQAPLWLQLDAGAELPPAGRELPATACASWTQGSTPGRSSEDCCSIQYPIRVRNCGEFFVYLLEPPHGCNMAYCAQPTEPDAMSFAFGRSPAIEPFVDAAQRTFLNCSVESAAGLVSKFRFQWVQVSQRSDRQLIIRSVVTDHSHDLLTRSMLTVGDKVLCQVEALLDATPGAVNPSVSSDLFGAGLVVEPVEAVVHEDGAVVDVTLTATVPFLCGTHVHAADCHLSVQVVQHLPELGFPLAVSQCQIQVEAATCPGGHCGVHRLQLVAVTDFAFQQDRNVTVELVLTSYGDSWWHGYRLPNITVTVKEVEPVQCYALTMGHVIDIDQRMETLNEPGRYLLYRHTRKEFQVWVEYETCAESGAVCVCGVDVQLGDDVWRLQRCGRRPRPGDAAGAGDVQRRHNLLARMALYDAGSGAHRLRVLESRQGKLLTVVCDSGARVRVRLERWGLSVSVVDGRVSRERRRDAVDGLCHADNRRIDAAAAAAVATTAAATPSASLCTCAPTDHAYLSNSLSNNPRCDPDFEDCPVECEPQSTVEWKSLFNSIDITDQLLQAEDAMDDQLQRDSPLIDDDSDVGGQETILPPASLKIPVLVARNMGGDVHWTLRSKRSSSGDAAAAVDDAISFYCSNFLVNSTVAVECGQYLSPAILKAIDVCVSDIGKTADRSWAVGALALLEDRCEIEAAYRQADWPVDVMGRAALPDAIVEALNCPDRCSGHGVCLHLGCVCQAGFSGIDCSFMDERPPEVTSAKMAGGRLCDIDGEDCAEVTVDGGGFIDSPELQCRVTAGHFDGARWLPTPTAATLTTPARFVDANRIVCHLGQRHVNATEELDLELEVTNDGHVWIGAGHVTLYHSRCRMCGLSGTDAETWPVCVDRDDVCHVDGTCFFHQQVNPENSCQVCLVDLVDSAWSANAGNKPPMVPAYQLKTVVYDGQLLEFSVPASDPEGDRLHFRLAEPVSDGAAIGADDGVLRWRAVSNALTPGGHDLLHVLVSDGCNTDATVQVRVDVLPCPCGNGGSCRSAAPAAAAGRLGAPAATLASNRIPSYDCRCPTGYVGKDCAVRVDFCQPNPCLHGRCHVEDDGYRCQCFAGYHGATCHKTVPAWPATIAQIVDYVEPPATTPTPPISATKADKGAARKAKGGCDDGAGACRNGGRCVRHRRCKCRPGFAGRLCQHSTAVGSSTVAANGTCAPACRNGGHCAPANVCVCKTGWTGPDCSQPICERSCLNGGVCSAPNKCTCQVDGYKGSRCQKAVCKPKCRRGGKCIGPGLCLCPEGYGGAYCELRLRRRKPQTTTTTTTSTTTSTTTPAPAPSKKSKSSHRKKNRGRSRRPQLSISVSTS